MKELQLDKQHLQKKKKQTKKTSTNILQGKKLVDFHL